MSTPRKPDDELERLLADDGGELGALYRRLPRMEPPRRLDRNVLNEAARAIHGRPPRRQRWLVGLGSAAGIVLAAGVAWHVGQDALQQPGYERARNAPTYVPVQPIDPSARRKQTNAPASADAVSPHPAPTAAPAAPAAPIEYQHSRSAQTVDRLKKETTARSPPPLPPPSIATPPPPPAPARQSEPFSSAENADSAASAAGAAKAEAKGDLAGSAAREKESAAGTDASAARAEKPARSATGPAPTTSAELRRDMQLAPQDWLAHIQQLLRQGRRQQAIESLQLFRRAHPDWQLSDDLRALSD
ncbi:MAG: hypothetical protein ABW187_00280 [Dokdonella sp.]